jgi:hypothetical protein
MTEPKPTRRITVHRRLGLVVFFTGRQQVVIASSLRTGSLQRYAQLPPLAKLYGRFCQVMAHAHPVTLFSWPWSVMTSALLVQLLWACHSTMLFYIGG